MNRFVERAKHTFRSHILFRGFSILEDLWDLKKCRSQGYFAQDKEDLFLLEYFKDIKDGLFIDVGASHPFEYSNTYALYSKGWSGINVEPIPAKCSKFKIFRPRDINLNIGVGPAQGQLKFYEMSPSVYSTFNKAVANSLVLEERAILAKVYEMNIVTLTELYETYGKGRKVHILSIDTEGYEMEVLQGINWDVLRPQIILIESKTASQEYDSDQILELLALKGYKVLAHLGYNTILEFPDFRDS
jgi:FkbM family methyltransferase